MKQSSETTGGCQCGHVRYRFQGPPLTVYACHCTHCQKQSSSAFGLSVWVMEEDFTLEQGEITFREVAGDSGRIKRCGFCARCGSRIYHCGSAGSDVEGTTVYSVKGGTLDYARDLRPVAHIWARSAHKWLDLESSGLLVFETEPESFAGIVQAYREQSA